MLLSLSIRDFVLIEKLDLTFAHGADPGLGALTGETGAGKSILIDALGQALGARADSAAVLGFNFPGSDWYQDSYFLMTGEGTRPPDEKSGWFFGLF